MKFLTIYSNKGKIIVLGLTIVPLYKFSIPLTAGQEKFLSLHPGFYHGAHAAILVFDVTRKSTYKNLNIWYKELRQNRPNIPVIVLGEL